MHPMKLQAKHISTTGLIMTLDTVSKTKERVRGWGWVMIWELERMFPGVPPKVLRAKLRKLLKQGLIDGCACGCRGDYFVVEKGRRYIAEQITDTILKG